jgi:hypothetical protein
MPIISALGKISKEYLEFQTSLGYVFCTRKKKKKKKYIYKYKHTHIYIHTYIYVSIIYSKYMFLKYIKKGKKYKGIKKSLLSHYANFTLH